MRVILEEVIMSDVEWTIAFIFSAFLQHRKINLKLEIG